MSEIWNPDETDQYKAREAYIRYAAGIVMLNDPERLEGLHQRDVTDSDQQREIIVHAQTLMWAGLSDVIRYSNPPNLRSPFTNTENNYREAMPHMRDVATRVAENETKRLTLLNPALPTLRPLPVANEAIYKAIAHGRKTNVRLEQFMDAFTIDDRFDEGTGQLTFEAVSRITIANRESARHLEAVADAS